MFVPWTALLYDSTAATQTLKLSTTLLNISCGIHLISLLTMSCLVCGLFSQTLSFRYSLPAPPPPPPPENSQAVQDVGNRMVRGDWFKVKWFCPMESYAWGIQVFCSVLISQTEHLNTLGLTSDGTDTFRVKLITPSHPIPNISTHLTVFWGGTWKTEFVKTIHRKLRTSSEKKWDEFHKKCSIELWTISLFDLLLCCHTAVRCMEQT